MKIKAVISLAKNIFLDTEGNFAFMPGENPEKIFLSIPTEYLDRLGLADKCGHLKRVTFIFSTIPIKGTLVFQPTDAWRHTKNIYRDGRLVSFSDVLHMTAVSQYGYLTFPIKKRFFRRLPHYPNLVLYLEKIEVM